MKNVKIIKIVGNEKTTIDEYLTFDSQDIINIRHLLKDKGTNLASFCKSNGHTPAFAHNIKTKQSSCELFLKELRKVGIRYESN